MTAKKTTQRNTKRKDFLNLGYIPPQARELEDAILGAMMLENRCIDTVIELLPPDAFYVEANKRIFNAIVSLTHNGQPVDILTVSEQLKKTGDIDIVGGSYYVTKLTNAVVSSANIEAHCKIV